MAAVRGLLLVVLGCCTFYGCQTGSGGVTGNEMGSSPINKSEETAYRKAVNRCYKTGGTRVVKIKGKLRCF